MRQEKSTKDADKEIAEKQAVLQQKYSEYQMLEQQSKSLQEQVQRVAEQIYEIGFIKNSLKEFTGMKNGSVMLSPLSSGIFVKSKLVENNSFYVNVGSGVVVKKTVEEAHALMDKQEKELNSAYETMIESFHKQNAKLQALESELAKLTS
ncbi:prefoldin subunit alpha [Candidatus Woesearchaeota archaeon]|nr:prefoldin subunit alpha [Candidatus Woesearchaeota archaeon]